MLGRLVEREDQAASLPILCPFHSPLRKRVVAHIRQTREAAQRGPPPLPLASPSDQMAGQSLQHLCPSTSRHAEHPCTTHPKTPTVARSRWQERNDKYQFVRPPTTPVPAATKTATQESGF